jgi:tRNA threonylcarbamoyladenosine biosynthesis protein TsaE
MKNVDETELIDFGVKLGNKLRGGEVIELIGDIGAGKTTLVKGIAKGLGITEDVQSPSFTINRVYDARDNLQLYHYDFYRLNDPGIMKDELAESLGSKDVVTIIEWSGIVSDVLPKSRTSIQITATSELTRNLQIDDSTGVLSK